MPDLIESAIAAVVMFMGSTVLSTIGFGIGMTTIPVLLFVFDPQTVVVVVNTVSLLLFVMIVIQNRDEMPFRQVGPMAIAGIAAVPVGVFVLKETDSHALKIAISAVTILLTILVASRTEAPMPRGLIAGLFIAFGVSITLNALGIGGPVMALYIFGQNWSRNAVRGALSLYFLFVEAAGVIGYGVAGLMTTERITLILIVAVPVVLGFYLATHLVRRMNETIFRRATVAAIILMCTMTLAREIISLV